MKIIISFFTFITILSLKSYAQEYSNIHLDSICQFSKEASLNIDLSEKFIGLYSNYINSQVDLSRKDIKNQINNITFKTNRYLHKNCEYPNFLKFLPLTDIIDTQNTFTYNEIEQLTQTLKSIKYKNRLEIFIITVEDYFPYENKEDFAYQILLENRNTIFKKVSVVFLINLTAREVRISTDDIAKILVKDQFLESLINEKIIPQFKENNYYNGINNALTELDILTK